MRSDVRLVSHRCWAVGPSKGTLSWPVYQPHHQACKAARETSAAFAAAIEKVTSGKKVNTAADDAAYWSIATTMMSDHKAMTFDEW